jgi:hypothetical protein
MAETVQFGNANCEIELNPGSSNRMGLHSISALILRPKAVPRGGNFNRAPKVTPKVTPEMSGCPRSSAIVSDHRL